MYLGDKVALENLENNSICVIFDEGIMKNRNYGAPAYLVYVNQIYPEEEYQTPNMKNGIIEKGQMVRYKYCHKSVGSVEKVNKTHERKDIMDKYLVTYEYKEKDGSLILTKTKTEVLTSEILEKRIRNIDSYDDYLKILFCQKL